MQWQPAQLWGCPNCGTHRPLSLKNNQIDQIGLSCTVKRKILKAAIYFSSFHLNFSRFPDIFLTTRPNYLITLIRSQDVISQITGGGRRRRRRRDLSRNSENQDSSIPMIQRISSEIEYFANNEQNIEAQLHLEEEQKQGHISQPIQRKQNNTLCCWVNCPLTD